MFIKISRVFQNNVCFGEFFSSALKKSQKNIKLLFNLFHTLHFRLGIKVMEIKEIVNKCIT